MKETLIRYTKGTLTLIAAAFIGFFVSMTLSHTVGNPIENTLFPPHSNVTLTPMTQPVVKDGSYYARFLISNTGDTPLTDLAAEYNFMCSNTSARASLDKNRLESIGDSTFFDVSFTDAKLDYNCSPSANVSLVFFKDSNGKEYCGFQNVERVVCMYCETNVTIVSKEIKEPVTFTEWYPFSSGVLNFTFAGENCEPIEELRAMNLTEFNSVTMTTYDFSGYCIRGEFPLTWCKQQGYI